MAEYHHTVIAKATPFGEFTKWCGSGELVGMDDKHIRMANLAALLHKTYGNNQSLRNESHRSSTICWPEENHLGAHSPADWRSSFPWRG